MMTPQMHDTPPAGDVSGEAEISALYLRHYPQLRMHAHGLGCDPHTAEDAVQDVFLRLLKHDRLRVLATLPGQHQQASLRLRLRCQLINRWRDARRLRRGGNRCFVPLIQQDGYVLEVADERASTPGSTPRLCERSLHDALQRLRQELQPRTWQRVGPFLDGEEATGSLPPQSSATRVALHRARQRLRELLDQ